MRKKLPFLVLMTVILSGSDIVFSQLAIPTALPATDMSATGFAAHWSSSVGATSYRLDVVTDSGFFSYVPGYQNLGVGDVTSYSVNRGLTPNTTYYYRVRTVGIEGGSSRNSNISVLTTKDTLTFDIFPLAKDLRKLYAYRMQDYVSEPPYLSQQNKVDSGTVEYFVLDSTRSGDTTTFWTIQQTEHLIHHEWGNIYNNQYDTTFLQDTTVAVLLYEDLRGLHEIRCVSLVWHFARWGYGDSIYYRLWFEPSRNTYQHTLTFLDERLYFDVTRGLYKRDFVSFSTGNLRRSTHISADLIDPLSNVAAKDLSSSPSGFELHQNYPNPFNPSTTIKYELPRAAYVSLRVYDMLGREVAVLVNDRREAGVHEVKFDGANLASGVYFYRLQAGDFVQSKRLVLLK